MVESALKQERTRTFFSSPMLAALASLECNTLRANSCLVRREHIKNAAVQRQHAGCKDYASAHAIAQYRGGDRSLHETESWIPLTLLSRRLLIIDGWQLAVDPRFPRSSPSPLSDRVDLG